MRAYTVGPSFQEAQIAFRVQSQRRVLERAKQSTSILDASWRRVLAPGPRHGRWYTARGQRVQASVPGEVPQAVTQRLRNTGRSGFTTEPTPNGFRARVWFGSPVPYLPILLARGRVIFGPVVAEASQVLRRTPWPR